MMYVCAYIYSKQLGSSVVTTLAKSFIFKTKFKVHAGAFKKVMTYDQMGIHESKKDGFDTYGFSLFLVDL